LNAHFIYRYDTDTAQEPGSLLWFDAVMSLQLTKSSPLLQKQVAKPGSG